MAVAARKQPSPAEIKREIDVATLRLQQAERARVQYAEASVTNPKEIANYRRADEDVKLAQGEITRLGMALRSAEERARAADAERVAKDRAAQIDRIEEKLAARDQVGAELAAAVKIADEAFHKLITIGRDIAAELPSPVDPATCLLSVSAIVRATQHELFRVGRKPRLYGGQDEIGVADFPGGAAPSITVLNEPGKVPALTEELAAASGYLLRALRSGGAIVTPATSRPLSAAESQLADLHRRQAELAESPDADAEYAAIVNEIAALSAEIEAEKAGAQST